ncbi:MAG: hypothetical protein Q8K86_11120 [Candidatus Nanopelagicaceae bacterium]|nr:hypothetical protein [Candidatus Nanopelagicaceae bacterium]
MKIKSKTLVLSTVGAFALSYAIVGSSAFADTSTGPVPTAPSVTAPTTPLPTPLVSPIQAPAGLTSPSAGITQDDEDDDFDDLSDDADEVGDYDDEISSSDSDDQLTVSITVGDVNQSGDTEDETGGDD